MEQNKKDRVYTYVLKVLEENSVSFSAGEVKTSGQAFLRAIVECLWYLDGHHDALKKKYPIFLSYLVISLDIILLRFQNIEDDPFLTFQAPLFRCCNLLFSQPSKSVW